MTTKLAKSASNNGQIIKSWLPNDRRAKFLPSVAEIAYDLLRIEGYLGNVGLNRRLRAALRIKALAQSLQFSSWHPEHERNLTTNFSYKDYDFIIIFRESYRM